MALQQVPLLRAPPLLLAWLVVVLAWLPAAPCYTVHVSSRARTQLAEVRSAPAWGTAQRARMPRRERPPSAWLRAVAHEATRKCRWQPPHQRAAAAKAHPTAPHRDRPPSLCAAAQFVRALPLAGDAVDSMDEGERSAWAADLKLTAGQTLEALGAPRATITVDVKLVGFDGDGCAAGGWAGGEGGGLGV